MSWSQLHEVYWYDNPEKTIDCAVCNAPSSGRHYGVFTCEGCKCFFNRTVRYKLSYTCESSGNCRIDRQNRTQCQHCRFEKCVKVGMRRDAIRRGRPTKYSYLSRSSKSFTSQYDLITLLTQLERSARASITDALSSTTLKSSPCHKVWTLFSATLEWAKQVPMFSNLDICEKYAMLRCCWSDLFILVAAQYDLQIDSVALAYEIETCAGMCNERKLRLKQTLANFHECLLRLRGLEEAEYACLKVMVLFSSDSVEARCLQDAETSQEVVLSAMERYCKNRFPTETFRFGKILLKLMGLRAVNATDLEFLFFSKILHHTSIAGVIGNQLVSELPSPDSSFKETSFKSHK
ncbi:nuclear receptor subfamily 2 group F member 5-like [Orbicella faveolata]|uniref:nuclear receptor subfamily 2 group F member 5-like n=1 Tax=Orbicella faveolata TaxID=48498 RepID=UPI0009E1A2F8|nr:nuclear receptor subfamily 2 group F member 5-like [Orbicella faveolata]